MAEVQVEAGIVERLLVSFNELERAIGCARDSLAKSDNVPAAVFERLDSYDGIIMRQRELAVELSQYVLKGEVDQILRLVSLINGLSGMIIDDARGILEGFRSGNLDDVADEKFNYC